MPLSPHQPPTSRSAILAAARECLGTPWQHQARVVGHGIDCVGLLVHVATRLGMKYQDSFNYTRRSKTTELIDRLTQNFGNAVTPTPGSVLAFWTDAPGIADHVAIKTDKGLIHSNARMRKCIEHSYNPSDSNDEWFGKLVASFDFPGVTPWQL